MRDFALDDQQLIVLEPVAVLIEKLVEYGELDARIAVIEHDHRHAAAARHLDARAVNDPGKQDGMRLRRELIQPRFMKSLNSRSWLLNG